MKKAALLFIALVLIIPILVSYKAPRNGDKPYVEGEIMVMLRSGMRQNQQQMIQGVLADFRSVELNEVQRLSDRMNIFLLSYNPSRIDDERLLSEIKAHPYVEMAQFNHYIQLRNLYPNDNFFSLQWNLHNTGQTGGVAGADIHAPEGWDFGISGLTATGDTIVIAVVDDGFDLNHDDIDFWKNRHEIPDNNIDDDSNGYIDDYDGWNSWANSGQITEADHGTHVSGIAAARGNNGLGVSGVNWNVKVMPVCGSSNTESIVVGGYSYVYEMRSLYNETNGAMGAFIVATNSSFGINNGLPEDYPIWGAMYDSMGASGILSAAATANANWNVDEEGDIPTAFPSDYLISVTNTDASDVKSPYAAWGPTTIDLGAPGTSVYSTRMDNTYGYKTGTSMASPHVAGAVAYMFSVATADFMQAYHNDPSGMALVIKQYIMNSVDTLPSLVGKTVTGGRLNIYKAAQKMLEPDIIFNPMSVLKIMMPDTMESVSLSFTNITDNTLDYAITIPDTLGWISLSGNESGSLISGGTDSVMIHFNTDGLTEDTLLTFLTFSYGNNDLINIPVHLVINGSLPELSVNIIANVTEICPGDEVEISSSVSGGMAGTYTYSWTSDPPGFESTDPGITVMPEVTTTYYLEVSDEIGNIVTDSVMILVDPLPEIPTITSGPSSVDNYVTSVSTYTCSNAANASFYLWYVSPQEAGTSTSSGQEGEFTWSADYTGHVVITVIATNDCGNSDASEEFATDIYSSSGLDESLTEPVTLSPNPASNKVTLSIPGLNADKSYSVLVLDAAGNRISEKVLENGQKEIKIDVKSYAPGIYIAILQKGNLAVYSHKFIVIK